MKVLKLAPLVGAAYAVLVRVTPSSRELLHTFTESYSHQSDILPDVWQASRDEVIVRVQSVEALKLQLSQDFPGIHLVEQVATEEELASRAAAHITEVHELRYQLSEEQRIKAEIDAFSSESASSGVFIYTEKIDASDDLKYGEAWFKTYHPLEDIHAWYKGLAEQHPDKVTFVDQIAEPKTHEGRSIFAIRITSNNAHSTEPKKKIYVQSVIHAREWISGSVTQWISLQLVTNPQYEALIEELEFIIVPVVNPDGYHYTWESNRLWRKNRNPQGDGDPDWWFPDPVGVDLNRNFTPQWGNGGGSSNPSAEDFAGPYPESENEVQALIKFYRSEENIVGVLCFHAYSELVLRPWGWSHIGEPVTPVDECNAANGLASATDSGFSYAGHGDIDRKHRGVTPHEPQLRALADTLASGIANESGEHYTSEHAGDLYTATGTAQDWFYSVVRDGSDGKYRAPSFTIELRPKMGSSWNPADGFLLPPKFILPTVKEIMNAFPQWAEAAKEERLKC